MKVTMPMIEAAKNGQVGAVCSCHDCMRALLERALAAVEVDDEMCETFGRGWHEQDAAGAQVKGARRRAGLEAVFRAR